MSDIRPIKRALVSVSDKTGLIDFARALHQRGVALISTGGTRKALADAGIAGEDVSDVTGFPEMMDGRVKTLHPKVHGGLLAIRENPEHEAAMLAHGIEPIDLLVVNLYPFEATVARQAGWEETIENIDIGGPAMIRAAAKNHEDVAVVVDACRLPGDSRRHGRLRRLDLALRKKLAQKAYARTAAYDATISNWLARAMAIETPEYRAVGGKLVRSRCAMAKTRISTPDFTMTGETRPGVATARQLQGKQLSYNNVNDTDAAFELVAEFDPARAAAVAIIKHANPCGVAEGRQPERSLSPRPGLRSRFRLWRHRRA